jgi:hypothetical protein
VAACAAIAALAEPRHDNRNVGVEALKRSQLSCESWIATITQPSPDGPAT